MNLNRHDVLIAGLATAATDVPGGTAAAPESVFDGPSAEPVSPPFDGQLHFDEQSRAAAADDFGHIVHRMPEAVLNPASDQDVASVILWAGERGRKVAPRGQGHSVYGRAQVENGIVIDMTPLRTIHDVRSDRVVVDAGAKWSEVIAATLPQSLVPPVLPDYLELSVGGTLVVGGIGSMTSRYGMQCDNVLAMEVVTGKGETVTCSADSNADLFHAVRAGLGQVAVVLRVMLRLVPAPQQVRRFLLIYPDLMTMLADQRRLVAGDRFDAVQGAVLPTPTGWTFRLDAMKQFSGTPPDDAALLANLFDDRTKVTTSTLLYPEYLHRLAALEQALRANGQWFYPHPWLMTFIGDSAFEPVVSAELARMSPADVGPFGQVVLSAFRRQAVTSPLLRLPEDDLCYAFNLVRIPATAEPAEADRLVRANRSTYERIRAVGGTLYPVSAFPMSSCDWRRHFGSTWGVLRDAKQEYDPGHVLTPAYEPF
jgi:FAD/FMN-containing dehydrogenase